MHLRPFQRISHKSIARLFASLLIAITLTSCFKQASNPIDSDRKVTNVEPVSASLNSSNLSCGQITVPLTSKEQEYAALAWQYFVNNLTLVLLTLPINIRLERFGIKAIT